MFRGTFAFLLVCFPMLALAALNDAQVEDHWGRKDFPKWFDDQAIDGHALKLLSSGAESFSERYRIIDEAKSSIYISAFALINDEEGALLTDKLCIKSAEGLDVRIIADSYGSNFKRERPGKDLAPWLRDCNIAVQFYAPLQWGFKTWLYSMHEKMLLVDGKIGIFGGMSFSKGYRSASRQSKDWHDLDILVEGPTVCDLQKRYEEFWWKAAKKDMSVTSGRSSERFYWYGNPWFAECTRTPAATVNANNKGSRAFGVVWNPLFEKKGTVRPLNANYFRAILSSKNSVYLYAPYFIPHENMIDVLIAARANGVDVHIITNSPASSDENSQTTIGMLYTIKKLLAWDVHIHLWASKATMHRKAAVFDRRWAYVGSDNFDRRGQEYNTESAIFTDDSKVVNKLADEFELDMKMTKEIHLKDLDVELSKQGAVLKFFTRNFLLDIL